MAEAIQRSEPDLVVFISSVMNEELDCAREVASEAVDSLDFARSWKFESAPASSEPPDRRYLRKVAESDFVIWLVGSETTQPVIDEVNECIVAGRRLLVFKLPSQDRDEQTSSLLDSVRGVATWKDAEITQLAHRIRQTLYDELIRAVREPARALRRERLRERRSLSVSRCKEEWRALGVPEALADELSQDINVGGVLDYPGPGAHTVEGALGSGKTLASHRLFQLATDRALEDSSQPFPIFLDARELHGSLSDYIEKECTGYANPHSQGVFLVVDGVDEIGVREGNYLLQQASAYVGANSRATVLTTARPMFGLDAIGERITMPALDDDKMVALISKISGQELELRYTYGWPSSVQEAARFPLFAVMIGVKLRDNPEQILPSRRRLIEQLARDALKDAGDNTEDLDRLLHRLAACSITSGTRVPLREVDRMEAKQRLLTASRLVTESSGTVDFALPIFREWYAARALVEGTIAIDELQQGENQQISDRWLLPLSMALNSGDKQFIQSLMTHLASTDPGLASLLIHEHQREPEDSDPDLQGEATSLGTAVQAGEEILETMASWQQGLGDLYKVVGPVTPDGTTRPLRIGLAGQYIETYWYHGAQNKPPVAPISLQEARDRRSSYWSMFGMDVPDTELWPWVFAKRYLARSSSKPNEYARLAISADDAIRELSWEFALAVSGQSRFDQTELGVQGVLSCIANMELMDDTSVRLSNYSINEIQAIEKHLRDLLANQETVISDPWPQSDRTPSSGPVWDSYSERQLLARTRAVYSGALRIYSEMVERWYQKFAPRLRLYSLMPVRLEGRLEVAPQDSPTGPKLMWHPRILPRGEQSEAAIEFGTTIYDRDKWITYFSEESENFARLRNRHARDARLFRAASLVDTQVLGLRPATTMACDWLRDEMKDLHWDRW